MSWLPHDPSRCPDIRQLCAGAVGSGRDLSLVELVVRELDLLDSPSSFSLPVDERLLL